MLTTNKKANCRAAARRAEKKWYWKNREKKLARAKEWWQRTKEVRHTVQAKYRFANRDLLNEKRRQYVKMYPERVKTSLDKHRTANRKIISSKQAARAKITITNPSKRIKYLATMARQRSRKLGREFDANFVDFFIENPPEQCACCGEKLDYARGKGQNRAGPSIDRVDNARGYVLGNAAIICRSCNTLKGNHSVESLERVIRYMKNHFKLRSVA